MMKNIRYILQSLVILLFMVGAGIDVFAMDTGFTTEPMSKEDIDTFLKNTNITLLSDEPPKKAIDCFDVNDGGLVAIGFGDNSNKKVCIYTNDGIFQYGYSFECSGKFGIELNKNILNIYYVRSDVAVAVNPQGEIESVQSIQNTTKNNSYWNHSVYLNRRKIGKTEYVLQNDMGLLNAFASSYSQLVIIEANGKTRMIYDVNSEQFARMLFSVILVLLFTCVVIVCINRTVIKGRRWHRG